MPDPPDDDATLQVLMERLVDAGGVLSDSEIDFLQRALEDARDGMKFVARHPEVQALGTQVTQLYEHIVRKAMENEQRG